MQITKIISGGQTGADQGALEAALQLGIDHGGSIPKGRKTENGPLPSRYKLHELDTEHYAKRTLQNVLDGDGTLIVSHGPLTGGSALTQVLAIQHGRPCLHIDMNRLAVKEAALQIAKWIETHQIAVLNVAGPRASGDPDIFDTTRTVIQALVTELSDTH